MRTPIFAVLFVLVAFEANAVQIKLTKPVTYRKKTYQEFETKDHALSLLDFIVLHPETPEEDRVAVEAAIAAREYPRATNVVYFYPPLTYNNEVYYQFYIYKKGGGIGRRLAAMVLAAQARLAELSPEHRAIYVEAIRRMKLRLAANDEEDGATKKKRSKKKKSHSTDEDEDEALDEDEHEERSQETRRVKQPRAESQAPPAPAAQPVEPEALGEFMEEIPPPGYEPAIFDFQADFSGLPDFLQ